MRPVVLIAAVAGLLSPLAAWAQEACPAQPAAIPAELAGWAAPSPLTAATDAAALGEATLEPGRAYLAKLAPTPSVQYPLQPEKPGGSVSRGGLFALTVEATGTYVVALGSAAWLDVVRDGTAVVSTGHGRGPACSTIRKMVDFPLQPGRYVVQVSANADETLPIMVARRP